MKMRVTQKNNPRASEQGSMLFYILLGVVLFAALAFTVSRGMRGTQTNSMSKRKAELAATEILDYAQKVGNAVNRLRQNGCSENEISFDTALLTGYTNANSPVDNSCHIFNEKGGRVTYTKPNINWLGSKPSDLGGPVALDAWYQEWYFTDSKVSDIGTDAPELIALLAYITKPICIEINNILGVPNPGGNPIPENSVAHDKSKFDGDFSTNKRILDLAGDLNGVVTGCFEGGSGSSQQYQGTYGFYQVLIER